MYVCMYGKSNFEKLVVLICSYVHACFYMTVYDCMYVCLYVCMYLYVYVCVCVYVYVYMYMYICMMMARATYRNYANERSKRTSAGASLRS